MPLNFKTNRKQFISQVAMLAAGLTVMPKSLLRAATPLDDRDFTMNECAIIDMHCHPSMKMFLWGKKFWNAHWSVGKGDNLFPMQENERQFSFGNVRGIMAAHYLLEAATEREWHTLKALYPILKVIPFLGLNEKIEHEDPTNFDQVMKMITILEGQMDEENKRNTGITYKIAKNFAEYEAALDDVSGKTIAIAHAIEGGHALGRDLPISHERQQKMAAAGAKRQRMFVPHLSPGDPWDPYITNLLKFHEKGVCLMTLSHFFRNDLVYPVDGISPDAKKTPGMAWEYTPDQDRELTVIGEKVVEKMLEIGMVVDLTHTAPMARHQVFLLNREVTKKRMDKGKNPRPVVFTHTGAQQIYEYYDQGHYPFYKAYCASDEEIALIEECNGVIGVIAEDFWLTGADANLKKEFRPAQFRDGISYIIQTMKYINSKTEKKRFDNIGIGTDFDGLADNPKDLYKNKQIKDLIDAMKRDPELNIEGEDFISKITYKNAKRVLKDGWG
ncbi:membrane dipeptidase [Mucilaginibacter sp. X5P1]|uniref:membrane dipeptidase n=1 Tax=Mucilaginibacter sp. X5P1 TaxID=2723088 RepID=UPI00160A93CE|nr:membrane dipeptidase [Mucilaginibacter sp. X5P1]MBB6141836.1 microsomal dipeptidase-like Zn-dependent dipeptidase [Mucilaginibacter sp. X5P1]